MQYDVRTDPNSSITGRVTVRFSELPVAGWRQLSNEDKRRLGITKGAGVSVLRAGREVDYGWFFMGTKHRENYDDWWRCEIQFEPILDEAFGISHTKQQIRPTPHLLECLTPDIEAMARALNARARVAHQSLSATCESSNALAIAEAAERSLPLVPSRRDSYSMAALREIAPLLEGEHSTDRRFAIVERASSDTWFFMPIYDGKKITVILNTHHPFYGQMYAPLRNTDDEKRKGLRTHLDLMLLAAARSSFRSPSREAIRRWRDEWSNTLATYLLT